MSDPRTFDPLAYRGVLGHFATGVVVVASTGPDGPAGMAANSFTSISLDPPLVAFAADNASTTWPRLRTAGAFAISILGGDQEGLARGFASRGVDRFQGVTWHHSPQGHPVLDGALAWLDCRIETVQPAGDHELALARVLDLSRDVDPGAAPLVFFRGRYARLIAS